MPRVSTEYRTASRSTFNKFKEKFPEVEIDYTTWANIIYSFNYAFRDYALETGYKIKFIHGFGDFAITKWRPNKIVEYEGEDKINLPIDFKRTKELGKTIYHMNYHTDGYKFRWKWFKKVARICMSKYWNFKPSRISSRLLKHYISLPDYQDKYLTWKS